MEAIDDESPRVSVLALVPARSANERVPRSTSLPSDRTLIDREPGIDIKAAPSTRHENPLAAFENRR
jgi:hypothetical protein